MDDVLERERFVFGRGEADPAEKSVAGFKAAACLEALREVRGELLEVGCGGGQYLRMLRSRRPDLSLHGVDLDPSAVAFASHSDGISLRCASAESLPYEDEKFDAVLGFDILEHVEHPARAVEELYRVLRKGGSGFFYVPCEGNEDCIYSRLGHHDRKRRHIGHIQRFRTAEVLGMFRAGGFTVDSVKHTDFLIGQLFDYLFFRQVDRASDPAALWAAQGLETQKGNPFSYALYLVRIAVSAVTWCEWKVRSSQRGSMGVIVRVGK